MQARMKNPAVVVPGAMEALWTLGDCATKGGVPQRTLDLVHLRAAHIRLIRTYLSFETRIIANLIAQSAPAGPGPLTRSGSVCRRQGCPRRL